MSHDANEPGTVVVACDLDAPPQTVWRALTTPELVSEWLAPCDRAGEPGADFALTLPEAAGGRVACEVLEAIPHERLALAWRPDGPAPDTVVTFELAPRPAGGTHLRIVHTIPRAAARLATGRTLAQLRPHFRRRPVTARAPARLRRAA